MDPLSDMLAGIRADRATVDRLEPGRRLRLDGESLTMLTVVGGEVLLTRDRTEHKVRAGSTAIVRGPDPFAVSDLDAPVPGPEGPAAFVYGAYRNLRPRHERLLRTLPPVLVLEEDDVADVLWLKGLDDALDRSHQPGGQSLVDRVLDWGLVCTLSCWFDRQGTEAPGWYRGALDPVAGPALEALHQRPAQRWTVAALAAAAGVSRAHFAKRFTEIMGRPPLAYLTEWRMCLAEDLLADPDLPVAAVAKTVGYADPFAFSTAFKRLHGMSPRDFRARRA
jgi:AraC-like DNA-binding protein